MFAWFRERKKFEKDTRLMLRAMEFWLQDFNKENKKLMERVDELEKVQKTLSDDMYDAQADLTLIHNIDGHEDWRSDIGKPVNKASFAASHDINCEFHHDQYPQECTCGAYKPVSKPTDIVK